ncbi:hypothetical protein CYMTET_34905 [Cymbomonas tetramitiformis]|uniref:Uncharacterized protein n=1 Tax=Cymbomonas tetramitiformis TaxID=36881 RepID=A0AAE0KPR1_9CHLO|nr:hypothetical protein CYMTET_34905 [Cymbomonas tetramitiformis]
MSCKGVNALAYDRRGEVNWITPPWGLLDEVAHKLCEQGAGGMVVALHHIKYDHGDEDCRLLPTRLERLQRTKEAVVVAPVGECTSALRERWRAAGRRRSREAASAGHRWQHQAYKPGEIVKEADEPEGPEGEEPAAGEMRRHMRWAHYRYRLLVLRLPEVHPEAEHPEPGGGHQRCTALPGCWFLGSREDTLRPNILSRGGGDIDGARRSQAAGCWFLGSREATLRPNILSRATLEPMTEHDGTQASAVCAGVAGATWGHMDAMQAVNKKELLQARILLAIVSAPLGVSALGVVVGQGGPWEGQRLAVLSWQ